MRIAGKRTSERPELLKLVVAANRMVSACTCVLNTIKTAKIKWIIQ
jgi:hypothetical protein